MKATAIVVAAFSALVDAMSGNGGSLRQYKPQHIVARTGKGVEQPITPPRMGSPTVQGCFKSSGDLVLNQTLTWNTIGSCGTNVCYAGGFPVGGTMGGNQCWCGKSYPPKSDLVDDSNCNIGCTGYDDDACGGIDYWTIYNTGVTLVVKYLGDSSSSSSSGSSTSGAKPSTVPPTAVVTRPGETVVLIQTPTGTASDSGGGTNVAGIAAGVVVGVVVLASAIGGGFLYMRRRRNREIEEEHRRNAAVNAFIGKPPGSSGGMSTTDSRLDPVIAHRRMSDGSIADNQDYSRRILRVTNA